MVVNKTFSLVFIRKNGRILLGLKKRGFGTGKYNGFGGKVEKGETMIECAKRELLEESGLCSTSLKKVGQLQFEFIEDPMNILHVDVFITSNFQGEPIETEEMNPKWFTEANIPYDKMWADDKFWFPLLLRGASFEGYFKYLDFDTIVEHSLKEVAGFYSENDKI